MRVETLDLFDVFVGFTGVEFQTSKEDVEVVRRKVFAVVYVQTISNFDLHEGGGVPRGQAPEHASQVHGRHLHLLKEHPLPRDLRQPGRGRAARRP